jgi:glycosyltransferase involved in cell wall biosynthesis
MSNRCATNSVLPHRASIRRKSNRCRSQQLAWAEQIAIFVHITFLNPIGQIGGAERLLLDLLATLRVAQPDWTLSLIAGEEGPLVACAADLGVSALALPLPKQLAAVGDSRDSAAGRGNGVSKAARLAAGAAAVPGYLMRLRGTLASLRPDILHTNGCKMHLLGAWAKAQRQPLVWHLHEYLRSRPLMSKLLPAAAPRCSAAIAISRSVAEEARSLWGNSPATLTIYNGINLDRFSAEGPALDLDKLAGLPPSPAGTARIGFMATLAWWKGHAVFLRALARITGTVPWRAYIVGGGIYRTDGSEANPVDLRRLAAELGIAHRVGFVNYVAQPEAALRAVDIVVHASTHPEPFGLVVAEAMASGRVTVASGAGGTAELIESGRNGFLHRPGDVEDLAASLQYLVENRSAWPALARAARRTAEERFDRRRLAAELIPVYRGLARINSLN